MTLKDEVKGAGKVVVQVGIATAAAALVTWIRSRPIKRLIEKRRAARAQEDK